MSTLNYENKKGSEKNIDLNERTSFNIHIHNMYVHNNNVLDLFITYSYLPYSKVCNIFVSY